ncbi:MAG: efflux transporter outer membrane subunit [Alphaproteobacteria bacterium]|nr:efflux transporter outer membrane subunit [Alphaproteobacteria bacterium]
MTTSSRSLKLKQTSTALLLVLSLAACEVGPDYAPPPETTPVGWNANASDAPQGQIDQTWWDHFHDPVLTKLIARATTGNFDIKIAEARIAQARAGVSSAAAALLPQGDVKGTATREANQIAMPGGSANSFAPLLHKPFNIYETGFDASWELDLFGGNRRAEEAATAQLQASEASRADVMVSLRAEVARTYVQIRQYQTQIALARKTVAADAKTLSLTRQRFAAGEAPRLDVTQAEAALEQARQRLPTLRNALGQAEYSLDVLLGAQPGTAHGIVATPAPIPVAGKALVLATPAAVIANRPDIRVAERKLAAATAQQGEALAKFFPDISLNGFFGALNTSTEKLITGSSESWMAGGSVLWPILSYNSLSANLHNANAQQQEAMATYQKTVLSALADVEKSLTAYDEQQQFLAATKAETGKDADARRIASDRYKAGVTSLLDVLDAERTLYAAQDQQAKARSDEAQDLIALYKSLGGGWATSQPGTGATVKKD